MMQTIIIILYCLTTSYDQHTDPKATDNSQRSTYYGMYQDIHVMIFIGFGFLMTFLRSYGFSSLTLNFLVGIYSIEWGILVVGFFAKAWESDWSYLGLNIEMLIEGDFAAATALISLGAVLGKTSAMQTLIMVTFELIFYALNFQIGVNGLGAADIGATMFIHTFGAYFGLAVSWVMSPKTSKDHKENGSVYHSDMFSMVGTIFLWVFWPSFVSVLADGNNQDRAILHTVLAISSSCMCALLASSLLRPDHKFDMVDVQNATLAGGVTIGAVADHYLGGGGALFVGAAAGILSTIGYVYVQPALEEKIGLFDTCGVHNLHGMPGVLGGLASVVSAACAGKSLYGDSLGSVFGAMAPEGNDDGAGEGRSASQQAVNQLLALLITLGIAIASGIVTGMIMKLATFDSPGDELFNDVTAFGVPGDGPKPSIAPLDAASMTDASRKKGFGLSTAGWMSPKSRMNQGQNFDPVKGTEMTPKEDGSNL
mmetsp:Transcript_100573/g.288172  ORF Transcript_100573/g.288172 Transcript_100573/m.288172 type:complete len:482 (-) Transcript_100573:282-1727(-)